MPKVFSDKEREYIRMRLKEEAAKCMSQYGLKKTTVDELVKRVNIPKGTFYLFYECKEMLMFEVLNEFHEKMEQEMFFNLAGIKDDLCADTLTKCIVTMMMEARRQGIIRMMTNGDLELLMRRLPEKTIQKHMIHDTDNLVKIAEWISSMRDKDLSKYAKAFQSIFIFMASNGPMDEKELEEVIQILIYGIVIQLLDEKT